MTAIKNWIDLIRLDDYFNLIELNKGNKTPLTLDLGNKDIHTTYDEIYFVNTVPKDFPGIPPQYISMSIFHRNIDVEGRPHAESPAPAQRYGNVMFLWAEGRPNKYWGGHPSSEHWGAIPHREDGYPASIELINLSKYYRHGKLHRKGHFPALKSEHVIASWYENGKLQRSNGPTRISLEGYNEFWKNGEFMGYKHNNYSIEWNVKDTRKWEKYSIPVGYPIEFDKFLSSLSGTTDLFSNNYFTNTEDEFCFTSSFFDNEKEST